MLYSCTNMATVGVKGLINQFIYSAEAQKAGMLSLRSQRGFDAKIFGLGLGLGLMQCWPRSHEGCPRGLVVSQL